MVPKNDNPFLWCMKKCFFVGIYCLSALFAFSLCSCKDGTPQVAPGTESPDVNQDDSEDGVMAEGLSWYPEEPDADAELTINFKASAKSKLYGYKGNVYLHIGVVNEEAWLFVPAEWNENIEKCKMTSKGDNCWSISLSPSIREWFASGETPVNELGIVIRSEDGTKKGTDSDSFIKVTDNKYQMFQPAAIKEKAMPAGIREGINVNADHSVTFAFYDKDRNGSHKDFAHIVGDFNDWTPANDETSQMYRDNAKGCWWITLGGLDPDKEYRFQYYTGMRDGDIIRMADAYSEKILDPDNDRYIPESVYPSSERVYPEGGRGIVSAFKINEALYSWKHEFHLEDKDNLIIYELHLRDFSETSDIGGALDKLDYLQSLGVNAIELMPVQEFDGNDSWGYNPCFYFALDKAYGTKNRYKEFVDECHARGMAVIFDVVYNHATGSMPFAKLYWNRADNKTAENNPWFNVDAPHPYSVFHDFNHESELVRSFVKRNLAFLLDEYHIDGFRFDLTKGLTQRTCTEATVADYDAGRIGILKEYYDAVTAVKPEAVVILEHFCCEEEEKELAGYGMKLWRDANNAYCQSGMGWKEYSDFSCLYTGTNSMTYGGYVGFMESHDVERVAYKALAYGNGVIAKDLSVRMSQLAANAAFCFTVPGPKMIWQFGELGYDVSLGTEDNKMEKKPLHWDYYTEPERKGLYDVYAKLLNLRKTHKDLFQSDATFSWQVTENYWSTTPRSLTLKNGAEVMYVVGNFGDKETGPLLLPDGVKYDYMTGRELEGMVSVPAHGFLLATSFQP